MKKFLSLFVFLSLFFTSKAQQRNVILIIADDLGSDYCGFNENHLDTAPMPNVRKLLARGVRFKNAWANPVCSPTRAGMLTGRYSFRTGVGDALNGSGVGALDATETTIPKLLNIFNPNGISKANIGKWHLQEATPAANLILPNTMGYDHFEGNFLGQIPSYTNWNKITNGVASTITTYATTDQTNSAISWINAQQNKPFFLWLAYTAPHTPFHLPPTGLHSYTTLSGTTAHINANPKSYYKAAIEAMDTEIGRLFDALQASGKWDNTDIIFIGDNGDPTQVAQNTGGAKSTIYQEGISVPFIISGPSVVNPSRVSEALVNTQDLFATVLELFGYTNWRSQISASKPVDSKSILPILKNEATDVRDWAFTEVFSTPSVATNGKTMRNKFYKLLNFDNGTQKFYKIDTDPTEDTDLLTSAMSAEAGSNYNYLCREMTQLVGTSGSCSILPIELLSFQARPTENGNLLNWATANELNNNHFDVERSDNGVDFKSIGQVKGNGNTNQISTYSFVDKTLLAAVNYYRLKQVNTDGTFTYSKTISVSGVVLNKDALITISPNPANDVLIVQSLTDNALDKHVDLLSLDGRIVLSKTLYQGSTMCFFDLKDVCAGSYFVRIVDGQQTKTLKIVIGK